MHLVKTVVRIATRNFRLPGSMARHEVCRTLFAWRFPDTEKRVAEGAASPDSSPTVGTPLQLAESPDFLLRGKHHSTVWTRGYRPKHSSAPRTRGTMTLRRMDMVWT